MEVCLEGRSGIQALGSTPSFSLELKDAGDLGFRVSGHTSQDGEPKGERDGDALNDCRSFGGAYVLGLEGAQFLVLLRGIKGVMIWKYLKF